MICKFVSYFLFYYFSVKFVVPARALFFFEKENIFVFTRENNENKRPSRRDASPRHFIARREDIIDAAA